MTRAIDAEVGRALRKLRIARGLSQQKLVVGLGVSYQQLQKYENGTNGLSIDMLIKLAGRLAVEPSDLLPNGKRPHPGSEPTYEVSDRETLEVLKAYGGIGDEAARKAVRVMLQAVAALCGVPRRVNKKAAA